MRKIYYIIIILLFTSCDNFLSEYSQDLVSVKTISDVEEVLLGSGYVQSYNFSTSSGSFHISSGEIALWLNFMDDDINRVVGTKDNSGDYLLQKSTFGYSTWQYEVERNPVSNGLEDDSKTWNAIYRHINIYNIILNSLKEINVSDNGRGKANTIKAEVLFLRAQLYFMLVNLYAEAYSPSNAKNQGIPLKLTHYVEYEKDKKPQFERTTLKTVYGHIVEDLNKSIDLFKKNPQTKNFNRASEASSTLLLSRVYLFMQDYENAQITAQKFITERPMLSDMASYQDNSVFMNNENVEIIFSQGSFNLQTNPISGVEGAYCASKNLISLYDTINDYRLRSFFKIPTSKTDSVGLGNKYRHEGHRSHISDIFTLRSAEAYLNLAEASAIIGNEEVAKTAMNNLLKNRIKDFKDITESGNDLIRLIRNERRKELCFEGHRWFDLRRYAVAVKAPYVKNITRVFPLFNDNGELMRIYEYLLPVGDPSYTLQIPKSVIDDDGIIPNKREKRLFEKSYTLEKL